MNKIFTALSLAIMMLLAGHITAQQVTLDLSEYSKITAVTDNYSSQLALTNGKNDTDITVSYNGIDVNTYKIDIYTNEELTYTGTTQGGPNEVGYEFSKERLETSIYVDAKAIGWIRALRLLPCIEGEYNSDGSWYIRFDCHGSSVASGGDDQLVPVAIMGEEVGSGNAMRITPVTNPEIQSKNISLTKS